MTSREAGPDAHAARDAPVVETVVKLGGGLLAHPAQFEATLAEIGRVTRARGLLLVPGGGPFADTVREVDHRLTLSPDAAHWMAVLAMDQFAHLIVSRLAGTALVALPHQIGAALRLGHLPVLAPSRWLREADPLPHTWDVTSDSIAAWVAGEMGARRLVLVKPPGATDGPLVDAYFSHAVKVPVVPVTVPADRVSALRSALRVTVTNS